MANPFGCQPPQSEGVAVSRVNSRFFNQLVCIVQALKNDELGRLQKLSTANELIQDAVDLVKIEDKVQFAHLCNR